MRSLTNVIDLLPGNKSILTALYYWDFGFTWNKIVMKFPKKMEILLGDRGHWKIAKSVTFLTKNAKYQLLYNYKRWHLRCHLCVKRWHFEQKGDTLKFSLKFQKNENFIGILRWIKISQRCHLFDEKHKLSVIIQF